MIPANNVQSTSTTTVLKKPGYSIEQLFHMLPHPQLNYPGILIME